MQLSTAFQTTIYEDFAAATRLAVLGLDFESLGEVVRAGESARAHATANDPGTAAGYDAYRYRVRKFRDIYIPRGWTKQVERGVELTRSPDGSHAIITRGGNEGVCNAKVFLQPQRKVGDGTRDALNPDWFNVAPVDSPAYDVRMLLVYRDRDIVKAELSLPTGITADGEVSGWSERIFLPSIDLSATPASRDSSDEATAEEIDVVVTRKR